MGITLKKIIRGLKFFLSRAPKFLNPALQRMLIWLGKIKFDNIYFGYTNKKCHYVLLFFTGTLRTKLEKFCTSDHQSINKGKACVCPRKHFMD